MAATKVVDIEEIIVNWAKAHHKDKHRDIDGKEVETKHIDPKDINLKKMFITHLPAEHTLKTDPRVKQLPKSNVIFSSEFTNDTEGPQTYTLRTERKTKSTCKITMTRTLTLGINISLQLTPPNPIITANAGFKSDLTVSNSIENNFEEELTWSLDSPVTVPAGYHTKAKLVIEESEYDGSFRVESIIEGRISINYRSKKDNEVVSTVFIPDIGTIFTPALGFEKLDDGKYKFVQTGFCFCRYGIRQNVKLRQKPIVKKDGKIVNGK